MGVLETYQTWCETLSENVSDRFLLQDLQQIREDTAAINDRFWRDLEFGTGGLRGLLGAGTNRMNLFTVGKATQGLANYLHKTSSAPKVAIAYDTRNFSRKFATHAASVFVANHIQVYLFKDVRPTPMLSFAVRHLNASAGIVITASHNPKEYNGYKVYGSDGGQITDEMAAAILKEIQATNIFVDVKVANLSAGHPLLTYIGEAVDFAYYEQVKTLILRPELLTKRADSLKILYSPLHGSGNIPIRRILSELGFLQLEVVTQQELPDGNFPTVPYPNPEEPAVYKLAINHAKKSNPDLIVATDPDCDRIGVLAKKSDGEFSLLTGNQIGALLCDYIIKTHIEQNSMPSNPAVIKTIVTSDISREICKVYDVALFETLTGFKYIGELAEQWKNSNAHSFLLGFEESYGYLAGNFVRDKDAVIAAALIAEMTLYYQSNNLTLFDAMENLYSKHGYYQDELISVTKKGEQGQQEIFAIMSTLREQYQTIFAGQDLTLIEDYYTQQSINVQSGHILSLKLPRSNVLKFTFSDNCWMVFRPSGTEPKIKVYLDIVACTKDGAQKRLQELKEWIEHTILAR